jgi:Na+/H+ antiporter NhaD/arsenite permease-like protein
MLDLSHNLFITVTIVLITYIGIAFGFVPRLKVNRTTIALIGVGLLLLLDQVDFYDIGQSLDFNTLVLLFSMMVINANLRLAGFFRLVGSKIFHFARNAQAFLALEIITVGLLSAFFLNDTICIMFTPLVIELMLSAKRNPIPYLIALATAANIGSVATITGNPQNMIIGIASGISYIDFSFALLPVALLGLGAIWLIVRLFYPQEITSTSFDIPEKINLRIYKPLLIKSLVTVSLLLIAFFSGVPVALASFIAACALLLTRRIKPDKVFAEFDWELLVFFSALFILTGALESSGLTAWVSNVVSQTSSVNVWNLTGVSVILSNLVSNVPAVLLLRPIVQGIANPQAGWLTLAAASTLAGNLTLLGSVANLIVAESARQRKIDLSFWEYTRAGAMITLISLAAGTLWSFWMIWR